VNNTGLNRAASGRMVEKLHIDEFYDTHSSAYVIRIIKSRALRLFEPADETRV